MTQSEKDLYRAALDTFGPDKQMVKYFEETAELQKELCKNVLGLADNEAQIAEEIADVLITLGQQIVRYDCELAVAYIKAMKEERLWDYIRAMADDARGN